MDFASWGVLQKVQFWIYFTASIYPAKRKCLDFLIISGPERWKSYSRVAYISAKVLVWAHTNKIRHSFVRFNG